jgi:Holliday junction resolvase-like predicted endonuclease
MTRSQVLSAESSVPISESKQQIQYYDMLSGSPILVAYDFVGDTLTSAIILIQDEHVNRNLYIQDYRLLKKNLIQKYGEPISKEENHWKNNLYREEPDEWGMAIAAGHLIMLSQWRTSTTEIDLILRGDNFEITHAIRYTGIKFKDKQEQKKLSENLDKL